jgi:hydrogenase-4 component B
MLGLMPALGFAMVAAPTALLVQFVPDAATADVLQSVVTSLNRLGMISATVAVLIGVVWWLSIRWQQRPVQAHKLATWGCGYTAPNARMQYTGSSFSKDFSAPFKGLMVLLQRKKEPLGYFPTDAYVVTDCVDAVERRLYNVIGHGDDSATDLSQKLHEDDPRRSFAAGLFAIVVITALVLLAEGALP